jgi:drug/metabolite transporter (DMT)-like permease
VGITLFATRMLARQFLGVLLGFIGSLGLVLGGAQINSDQPVGHVLLIISASMCYAINIHFLKHKLSEVSPMAMTLGNFIAILPPALILLFISDFFSLQNLQKSQVIKSLGFVATLAFFGTAIAKVMFNRFVKIASTVFVSSVTYTLPIVALFWGTLDGEQMSAFQLIGAVVILIGVSLAHKPTERQ